MMMMMIQLLFCFQLIRNIKGIVTTIILVPRRTSLVHIFSVCTLVGLMLQY